MKAMSEHPPLPTCRCGGRVRFKQPIGAGYIFAWCDNPQCGKVTKFASGTNGAYLTYVNDAKEFMRRFAFETGAPESGQVECWPILPSEAQKVSQACEELHIDVDGLCRAATCARQNSEEVTRQRIEMDNARALAKELIIDLMSGVDMDNPADELRMKMYGSRLRILAGIMDSTKEGTT